jgi:hypothetical protein
MYIISEKKIHIKKNCSEAKVSEFRYTLMLMQFNEKYSYVVIILIASIGTTHHVLI